MADKLPKYVGWYMPTDRSTDYDGRLVDPHTGEVTYPPSMTKQAHKDECDINHIMKQYQATGIMTHLNQRAAQGQYMDLPDPLDFQESLHMVRIAQEAFASLPSTLRNRFDNDPAQFLDFVQNPANADELVELGLAKRRDQAPAKAPDEPPAGEKPPGDQQA